MAQTFNVDKCNNIHIGTYNGMSTYVLADQQLIEGDQQQDLEILITKDFKWKSQMEAG